MNKAVIYARVSSTEQRESGYSLPAQVKLFREYAQSNNLIIIKEYEESESAKNSKRKLFHDMLKFVKQNQIHSVVFEKVDRMTRNFNDLLAIYELMEKQDVKIHLVKNGLV